MLVLVGMGGVIVHAATAGAAPAKWRKLAVITHGVGLLLLLLGGFGAMARLKLSWEGWLMVKVAIWVTVGALPFVLRRKPDMGVVVWISTVLLGGFAAFLALNRPF